jgi:hypothetical protein
MPVEGATSQGTTVAFSGIGAIACVRSISLPEFSLETIDATCLGSAVPNKPPPGDSTIKSEFTKKIPGQIVDAGEISITMVFELIDEPHIPNGLIDTITITLPGLTGGGGTLTGTGFISSCQMPSLEPNGLLEQTITFVFNGATGPTYTAGS